ncbi:MAG: hypothetical protein ACI4S3_10655, partial [Candidatus Gastranaerophilaceae bacterium]
MMYKNLLLEDIESAIEKAINDNKLGSMEEYSKGSLIIEKPKNPDFGDFAVNVSSLARQARIAPPMIANAIVEHLTSSEYSTTVVGGFINFKLSNRMLTNV